MYSFKIRQYCSLLAIFLVTNVFAAENEIGLSAEVDAVSVVGFSSISAGNRDSSTFADGDNQLDFGSAFTGDTHAAITKNIFVLNNNSAGINMTISDTTNNGHLTHALDATEQIVMNYQFDSVDITLGTAFTLSTGRNDGTTSVGLMSFTPDAVPVGSLSGAYETTLTVAIVAI
tara:strand:+ start:2306 stop:2827 length:522 start_codon:yes stop_codon:yes gene_type:complete